MQPVLLAFMPRQGPGPLTGDLSPETGWLWMEPVSSREGGHICHPPREVSCLHQEPGASPAKDRRWQSSIAGARPSQSFGGPNYGVRAWFQELPQGQRPLLGWDGWGLGWLTHLALPPILPSPLSVGAFVKTWLPFVLLLGIILTASLVFNLR